MKTTLSIKMMHTLQKGKNRLDAGAGGRIRKYIELQATPDGLFADKSGCEDIYYTAFGWALACVFGVKIDGRQARRQLQKLPVDHGDLVRHAAYIRSVMLLDRLTGAWGKRLLRAAFLPAETGETPVFSSFPHNDARSPYSTFVRLSLMEDLNRKIRDGKEMLDSLAAYRATATGGYSNIAGDGAASVNATAAALSVAGQLKGYAPNDDVAYLYRSQDDSGGFSASEQAPLPDMLSTATALFTLNGYGVKPRVDPAPFIEAHWLESGSFAPTLPEEDGDIEYTFYGLLALGASC